MKTNIQIEGMYIEHIQEEIDIIESVLGEPMTFDELDKFIEIYLVVHDEVKGEE